MKSRLFLSLTAVLVVVFATVAIWKSVNENEDSQIARIAESESYAARSRLVRNVDTMLRALADVHIYWSTFGGLPRDQWADDASIELSHFEGLALILWNEPEKSLRYIRDRSHPEFDYRPSDEEWALYESLLRTAESLESDQLRGPFQTAQGKTQFELYLVPKNNRVDGILIALIEAKEALDHLLGDDSPGFAITVAAGDNTFYQRNEPGKNLPDSWTRSGLIENSLGNLWKVTHTPTDELAASLRTPAIDAILYSGIAIAVLIGLLLMETGRAGLRARDAIDAQAQLAELNKALEQQVAERTAELEERSRDLVTITDSVGHDLRNPLNSISANIQLLEQQYEERLGKDGLDITAKLSKGVVRMTEILDRLLSLSTVSNAEFARERLDMREMAEEIFSELMINEPEPAVRFELDQLPDAQGEPIMVQTLIMNLLSNALKYTRTKQDRRIKFSFRQAGAQTTYYVRDNGIGFSSEMSKRIFAAFERLPSSEHAEGLGLGLDIASRVVRAHDGKIWAEGEPGEGATFYFTLGEEGVVS